MSGSVCLPPAFFSDRSERGLPMPAVIRSTAKGYLVASDDPALPDYLSDAVYHSDVVAMSGDASYLGLQSSARASAKALRAARVSEVVA